MPPLDIVLPPHVRKDGTRLLRQDLRRAHLLDASLLEHGDLIVVVDGVQTMGNGQDGDSRQIPKLSLDQFIACLPV